MNRSCSSWISSQFPELLRLSPHVHRPPFVRGVVEVDLESGHPQGRGITPHDRVALAGAELEAPDKWLRRTANYDTADVRAGREDPTAAGERPADLDRR